MSTVENYDGLCGCTASFASSDLRLKCHYELGHDGDCSWKKYEKQFSISSHCGEDSSKRGFIDAVVYHKK